MNGIREKIRNRFSPKGTISVVSTTTQGPIQESTQEQQHLDTTVATSSPAADQAPIKSEADQAPIKSEADQAPIKSEADQPPITSEADQPPITLEFVTEAPTAPILVDILDAVRVNQKNIFTIDSSMITFRENLAEISEILMNLNDQVATYNEISRSCFAEKETKLRKKPAMDTGHSNIIKLEIIKSEADNSINHRNVSNRRHHWQLISKNLNIINVYDSLF